MAAAIPVILAVATVASTAYSVYSSNEASHEQKSQRHDYERQLALKREADVTAERDRRQRILASQRARYAASGLTMEGSPLLVQADTIAKSEENLARIMAGADISTSISQSEGRQESQAAQLRTGQTVMAGAESSYKIGRTYDWW